LRDIHNASTIRPAIAYDFDGVYEWDSSESCEDKEAGYILLLALAYTSPDVL